MANINDYLKWRGDLPICKDYEFNEVDSMILARLSYLIFDKIEMKEKETIGTATSKMKDFDNEMFLYNGDKELATNLSQSRRFKDLVVTNYVRNSDDEIEKQFGAITIHLPNNEMYISYIGTDSTITGWKEDFNMSFMENVPCQIAGKEYLENVASKYRWKKIRIGGHSKGGNVAIYSAITVSDKIKNRIVKVYNYDGPGFNKDILNKYVNEQIISNIETYIPQDSIIGRLLYHKEKMTVILSNEKGILQHDIYSWQVNKDDLVIIEKNTDASEDIDKTITEWIEQTTNEQRKILVDVVFELIYSTDANKFSDLSKDLRSNAHKVMKKYEEISKEDKEVIIDVIKLIVNNYINILKEKETTKWKNIREEYIAGKTKKNK